MINIIGAGGMARDWIAYMMAASPIYRSEIQCFADGPTSGDMGAKPLKDFESRNSAFICVGASGTRKILWENLGKPMGYLFQNRDVSGAKVFTELDNVGLGTMICPGAIINVDAKIGQHCLIHVNSTVGHDTVLEDFVSLMPGVHVGGNCHLEEGVFVGAGAVINPGVRVGAWTKIGAGAIISHDLPANSVWVQAGAKRIS